MLWDPQTSKFNICESLLGSWWASHLTKLDAGIPSSCCHRTGSSVACKSLCDLLCVSLQLVSSCTCSPITSFTPDLCPQSHSATKVHASGVTMLWILLCPTPVLWVWGKTRERREKTAWGIISPSTWHQQCENQPELSGMSANPQHLPVSKLFFLTKKVSVENMGVR